MKSEMRVTVRPFDKPFGDEIKAEWLTAHRMRDTSHESLVTGHWPLVTGYALLRTQN